MLKFWNNLINTDCVVVSIDNKNVYPIFRNGSASLMSVCDYTYTNRAIANCKHIDVLIRDPNERFVSGLNEYCRKNNLDVDSAWDLADRGKLVDRHFAPQYMWLLNLFRFYKGKVTLYPFDQIHRYSNVHKHKSENNKDIPIIEKFVEIDRGLKKYLGRDIFIEDIIKGLKHALS